MWVEEGVLRHCIISFGSKQLCSGDENQSLAKLGVCLFVYLFILILILCKVPDSLQSKVSTKFSLCENTDVKMDYRFTFNSLT